MDTKNELLTVSEISKFLKVTPQYVRKLISDKKLSASRIGTQWIVSHQQLNEYITKYDVEIEPDDHERLDFDTPDIIALSFFSGAMGLDIGMEQGGIKALLACEFNKYCRMTINKNRPSMALIGNINNYSSNQILKMAKIPSGRKVDVIFGGPPCQAFSTAGARRALADERGNVFLRYIEVIKEIRPTYVVIENVRGLLSAPYPYDDITENIKGGALCIILDKLSEAGYSISFELYNAANFGAPQIRERVVMIGKLGSNKVSYLKPTHDEKCRYGLQPWRTLKEAFANLELNTVHHYIEFPEKRLKYYRMLTEGQYWKDLPPDMIKEAMGNVYLLGGGRTGFYRRLSYSKPSPTLVTNPTMPATDLCHPTENRPLSVEEYACIQEFPKNWVICGPILEQYKQIGNAVPIKLGEAIAKRIIADMNHQNYTPEKDYTYSRYKNTSDVSWKAAIEKTLRKARANQKLE